MRTIAIVNLKGGVAKTSTAINVAACLAHYHGRKILLIDADSQCNLTEFYQRDNLHLCTLADVLRAPAGSELALDGIEHSTFPGIDLLCADDTLMDLDLTKVETKSVQCTCLRDIKAKLEEEYDYTIIDCPPAFNAASAAALVAADEVIIPVKLDAFSLRGMGNLMQQINCMKKINSSLKIAGVLPTMWYKSDTIHEAERELRRHGLNVLPRIRRTNHMDDMTFAGEPLLVSCPHSAAAVDYRRLVDFMVQGEEEQNEI